MSYWHGSAPQSGQQGTRKKAGSVCSLPGLCEVLGFRDQKVERRRLSFRTLTPSQELFRGGRPGMQKGGVEFSGAE